jgi:serine/threonine protein kinase/tetratricopeptide (TPR) repeat protein
MNADPNPAKAIFLEAVERLAPEQWPAFLERACAGQPELRGQVEALLEAHLEVGTVEHRALAEGTDSGPVATVDVPPVRERPGDVIGPYKLLQPIGEGGMGAVFMAEQTAPVQRVVALKVIKAGMDSRQVLARFGAERQALALMDHPNIAKVLDAGATEQGRPYFVMELVKGVPITDYCDEKHLTPRERLKLFVPVCQAVQHAHQKGIIHRDLKPSNVLVGIYDGKPVPKVIDFGVAKAAGPKLTEATLFTGFGTVIGTPEYMSPEQAQLDNVDIDTRSDIYSLGVLVYELLTGTTPFTKKDLEKAGMLEMLRVIREQEPPNPSTRLSTAEGLPTLAANRGTEPAKLTKLVRGELDWIVMKALEKDRDRRYETANGLAHDIEKYLNDEPVQACPPSAAYRFRKFACRNRTVLLTAALVAATLLVGVVASVWQAVRATRAESLARRRLVSESLAHQAADEARAQAVAQRELAGANLRKARQAVDDMYTQVAEKWLATQPLMEPIQRLLLEKALHFYQEFAQRHGGTEPEVRLETARAYRRVADVQLHLGATTEAETAFREASTRLKALAADFPSAPEYRAVLADTLHKFGELLAVMGRIIDEEKVHREALALQERLVADFPTDTRYQRGLARGQLWLGNALSWLGKSRDAEVAFSAAISLEEKLADGPTSLPEDRQNLANCLAGRGSRRLSTDSEAALKDYRRSIELFERLTAEFPNVPQYRNELADTYCLMANGGCLPPTEAEQTKKKALDVQRKLVADFPGVLYYRYDLVRSLRGLGTRLAKEHRTQEAIDALREAWAVGEKLANETHPAVAWVHVRVGQVCVDLVKLLIDAGRVSEANDLKRRFIEGSTDPESLNRLAWSLVAAAEVKERDPGLAVEIARKAVRLAPKSPHILNTLGVACYRTGDWKGAIAALSRAEELAPDKSLGFNAFFLAMAHLQLGHKDEARMWYDRAVAWTEKHGPKNDDLWRFRAEAEQLMKKEPGKKPDRP